MLLRMDDEQKAAESNPPAAAVSSSAPVQGNHIYFNSSVDSDSVIALTRQIDQMVIGFRQTQVLHRTTDKTPIWVHVQSWGGDPFPALALADQIMMSDWPIHSIIEGYCCSAATFIAMACRERHILPSSFMLIHQLTSFVYGTYEHFKDDMNLQTMVMEQFTDFYARRTKLKKAAIRKMLKRDSWLNAQQALDNGFVDTISAHPF